MTASRARAAGRGAILLRAAAFAGCTVALSALAPGRAHAATPGGAKPAATAAKTRGAGTKVDRAKAPKLPPTPALTLPKPVSRTLPNGLSIVVVEIHKAPVVDVTLLVRAGAVRDPDDLPGLATFTANMLDEGAGKYSALQIAEEADFLGASLSTGAGLEVAQVNLHVPRPRLEAGLALFADVALNPTFPKDEIARQRELRQTSLLQLKDQPTAIAPIAFNAVVYGSAHPYGRPANGNDAAVTKLDEARIKSFYAQHYRPENAQLLFVGDVTADEAVRLAQARFGAWSKGDVSPLPSPPAPAARPRAFYLVDKPGAAQSVIRIGHVGVPRATPDYFALEVMNTVLGGSFTSRLNQNLRETHGYTYGANSGFEMRRLAGPFRATASVVTAKTDSALIEFFKELRRIREHPVPGDELAKAKAYLTLGLPGDFETTAGAASRFAELLINELPADSWDRYVAGVRAVTAEDVRRVARAHIDPERFAVVVVGDRGAIEPGIRALNEGAVDYRDLWGSPITP